MKENFKALDGIRGLTALYVMIHHARLALTQSYQNGLSIHPEKYAWYDKLMVYAFSSFKFGHEAVIIFFVLSGFVIHLKQSDKNYNFEHFNVFTYFKKRVIRIYPTLIVSFILVIILDYFAWLFTQTNFQEIFSKYSYNSFFFNLFLIPDATIWGYNFPVWSLKHEWFFYILYPFLLWLAKRHYVLALLIIIGLYTSYAFGFSIPYIGTAAYTLTVWSLGCVLAGIYKNMNSMKWISYLLLLCFVYPFINKSNSYYPLSDAIFGLIVVGSLSIIIAYKNSPVNGFLKKFAWLGAFSYSIYLLHAPFLNFYQTLILNYRQSHALPYHLWFVLLSIMVTIPIIYLIYYFTERIALNYNRKI
ncbi:acyltransferase family protein [Pedobacter rhodius]|uniref:Acyltransferase n=1 Tax=Pedobacter rhodius TaxID=3004098 RepID=A0ABT4KS87_9SPHI|nr:acyltransferase [Pedobacter sp. SJ11]MCZ4221793.1 acyltransferase [Pedobacter sp. SJ11]